MTANGDDIKVKPHLLTVSLEPENQETPVHFLNEAITPEDLFFKRNHFSYPTASQIPQSIRIDGFVRRNVDLSLQTLRSLPAKSLVVPLECAGNRRALFDPGVYGVRWQRGAMSQAEWKGVSLIHLLRLAGVKEGAKEVVFEGADSGEHKGKRGAYRRSLPLDKALHPDTIVAYDMNRRPIPLKHGYPFRLIVPGWYAMASVKWLQKITVIPGAFEGPFQTDDYVYYPHPESDDGKSPVTFMKVNSLIQYPIDYSVLEKGVHVIKGWAWTGEGTVNRVEVSLDGARTWKSARIRQDSSQPYSVAMWTYQWHAAQEGEYTIHCRATNSIGQSQPVQPKWNRLGYGYNGIACVRVKVG